MAALRPYPIPPRITSACAANGSPTEVDLGAERPNAVRKRLIGHLCFLLLEKNAKTLPTEMPFAGLGEFTRAIYGLAGITLAGRRRLTTGQF